MMTNDDQNTPEMTLRIKKTYFDENLSEEDQPLVYISDRYEHSQDVIFRRKPFRCIWNKDQEGFETE